MKRLGLIGFPLEHSFSQKYFTGKFSHEEIAGWRYDHYPQEHVGQLPELLREYPDLVGLNVTIPHKESVIPFLDELDEHAATIGAVNTIQISTNRLIGFNTDWIGFRDSLRPHLTPDIQQGLVLGSGGSSKAVCYALKQLDIGFTIVSRKSINDGYQYKDLNAEIIAAHPLIINCTPLGTFPEIERFPPIPYNELTPHHLLFDLVYNPACTQFMLKGLAVGARATNGYQMLVGQAEAAWKIWNT